MRISDWSSDVCSSDLVPPLRPRPRHPDHALEVAPVVASRTASPSALSRKQRPDQCPLVIRYSNPLAQRRPQKTALNQPKSRSSTFVQDRKSTRLNSSH